MIVGGKPFIYTITYDMVKEAIGDKGPKNSNKKKVSKPVKKSGKKQCVGAEEYDDDYDYSDDEYGIFNFNNPHTVREDEIFDNDDDEDEVEEEVKPVKKKKKDKEKSEDKPKKKKKKKDKKVISAEAVQRKREEIEAQKKAEAAKKARIKAEKERAEYEENKRQAEVDMIQLVARREYLKNTLGKLNPGKYKDTQKIVNANIELKNIEETIASLCSEFGISDNALETGSKSSRFFNTVKRKVKNTFGKIRRFFGRNKDVILGVGSIVLPLIGSVIASLIVR